MKVQSSGLILLAFGFSACNPLVETPMTDQSFTAGAPLPSTSSSPLPSISPLPTQLEVASLTIPTSGQSVVLEFNSPATSPLLPANGITGFSLKLNGSSLAISSVTRTAATEVTIAFNTSIGSSDSITASYTTGNLTDSSTAGLTLPNFSNTSVINNSPWDSDAAAYFNAVVANGGTISITTKNAIQTLTASLKSDGLWAKLTEIYPIAGDQLAASLVKLKVASGSPTVITNYNFMSADYSETGASGGLHGNGTSKYLDTGLPIIPLIVDNISLGAYVHVDSSNAYGFGVIIGSSYNATGDSDRFYMIGSGTNGTVAGQAGIGSCYPNNTVNGAGFRLMSYNGSEFDTYQANIEANLTRSGLVWQKVGTVEIFNGAGTFYHDGIINSAFVGQAFTSTEESHLYSDFQAFETALTRNN